MAGRNALFVLALGAFGLIAGQTTPAMAETRTLKVHFVHTGERDAVTYKRNGRYIESGLRKLNHLVRDFRRNEPTRMDPRLYDLLWEVYQQSGSRDYIHVISGYRSPQTNAMLRRRSSGVAKKSQHMLGQAMDFYLPDVPLSKLRRIGMKFQVGGVGYYPKSGSPFVHLDVGNVRAWPRMSRQELVKLFPDGKTLHLPPDGKPLPGYQQAMADYKRRVGSQTIEVAGGGASGGGGVGNLLTALFRGGDEDEEPDVIVAAAERPAAASRQAATPDPGLPRTVPLPTARPSIVAPAVAEPATQIAALAPADAPRGQVNAGQSIESLLAADASDAGPADESYPDLLAYTIPVPALRGPGLGRSDQPQQDATAALIASAEAAMAERGLAADALRPALAEPDTVAVAAVPVPGLRPHQAGRIRPGADTGSPAPAVLLAGLAPAEADRRDSKGARPNPNDAVAAKATVAVERRGPELTAAAVTRWALARQRVASVGGALAPPAFVSQELRAAPELAYTDGFSRQAEALHHDRFAGEAVHFLTVQRFPVRPSAGRPDI